MNDRASATTQHAPADSMQLLRLRAVMQTTGLARSTVYRLIAEHSFPGPVKLSKRAVGWRLEEVRQWTLERPRTSR